jgi:PAS domain S-box-containing protein
MTAQRRPVGTDRIPANWEESEARYRALVEQLPVVAYTATLDEPSDFLYVSPQIEALLGYTPEDFLRKEGIWPDGIHLEDRPRVLSELRACRATGRRFASEYRFLRRDGSVVWLRDEGTVSRGSTGDPLLLHGVMQDVTERKRAERQLADAQAVAHIGSWEWDLISERLTWSDELYRIFGLEPGLPVSYPDTLRYIHPDDHATIERLVTQALKDHQPFTCPQRVLRPDGTERHVEGRSRVEVDGTGRAIRLHGTLQDITERRAAEDAVRHAQRESREQLRALAARLEEVREQDRKVMAREIHDELGQALTALRMDLAWLHSRLDSGTNPLAEKARVMERLVDQTIDKVRHLASRLRPAVLDDLGLVPALEWEAGELVRRTGIQCELDLPSGHIQLDDRLATTVFRILQEALTNVARHAAATKVRIHLRCNPGEVALEVRDNGRGITDQEIAGRGSLGLLGMRERALACEGEFGIRALPAGGTAVTICIPRGSRALLGTA